MHIRITLLAAWCLSILAIWAAPSVGSVTSFNTGGLVVSHNPADEGVYFDTPSSQVAYNVQIMKTPADTYYTIFHSEPRGKPAGYPGDSVKTGTMKGDFTYRMPDNIAFRLWGAQDDRSSLMYSPVRTDVEGWSGAGNPLAIRGKPGDNRYYVFFISVSPLDGNRYGKNIIHNLCEARTTDFTHFELRTKIAGKLTWKPYDDTVPAEWRRPEPVWDIHGNRIIGRTPVAMDKTQGLIGSICRVNGIYHFFYADVDSDHKTYLFHRTAVDIGTLDPKIAGWTEAVKVSGPLMTGMLIRVAKARNMDRWVCLYNGYREVNGQLRQDLFLQYTENLRITGPGGISSITFFDRMVGDLGVSKYYLGLASGGGVFAQHYFLTDEYGNLTVPSQESDDRSRGGMLTWADFSAGIMGDKVYRAGWEVHP
jgi:hypothetical protein